MCVYADRIEVTWTVYFAQIEAADNSCRRNLVMLIDCPQQRVKNGVCEACQRPDRRRCGWPTPAPGALLASCKERIAPAAAEFLIHCGGYYKDGRYSYDTEAMEQNTKLGRPDVGHGIRKQGESLHRGKRGVA